MKTIKMTVELMTNDREDTIIGIAGYSPDAINPNLLEKIMREVKGMGERLSKGYEEKSSCPCCQCNGCDCEEENVIEEEDTFCLKCEGECVCDEDEWECEDEENERCPECDSEMNWHPIGNSHYVCHCPNCDYIELVEN